MADPVSHDGHMSVEEYLALEHSSLARHELADGYVYAVSGDSRRHHRIVMNVGARLWAAARGGPCRVSQESVRLRTGRNSYYPHDMVACGREPDDPHVEDAPCLVVEVTSPSTARTDRRDEIYEGVEFPTPDEARRVREEAEAYR